MRPSSEEKRRNAERMLEALLLVSSGQAPRSTITTLTRELWPASAGQGTPFPGNGTATTIFDSLWNIEQHLDSGDYLLRDSDLRHFATWLREGDRLVGMQLAAQIKSTPVELAKRLNVPTVRYWVDGLGWHESVFVASLATGRCFVGVGPLIPVTDSPVVDVMTPYPHGIEVIEDLFDTWVVDADDLFEVPAVALPRLSLWRQDDNGVRAVVAWFRGRAKARAALDRFEALGHKQAYWLEESSP